MTGYYTHRKTMIGYGRNILFYGYELYQKNVAFCIVAPLACWLSMSVLSPRHCPSCMKLFLHCLCISNVTVHGECKLVNRGG